jgi:hypothetical protein
MSAIGSALLRRDRSRQAALALKTTLDGQCRPFAKVSAAFDCQLWQYCRLSNASPIPRQLRFAHTGDKVIFVVATLLAVATIVVMRL